MTCKWLSKLFGSEGASDLLQNCSRCLINVFKGGSTLVWLEK
jgi:hypothetical protein